MMERERTRWRRTGVSRTYRRWHHDTAARCPATGKTSFRSTIAARQFVASRDEWNGETPRVYRCEWGDWYHLTSSPTRWELARMHNGAA